jgi:O-methyltransferase
VPGGKLQDMACSYCGEQGLHIDADWYDSVFYSLETFYQRVSDGGFIVLDDFGHWEGAREAFYDFCMEHSIKPLIERTGYTQAFWRKRL